MKKTLLALAVASTLSAAAAVQAAPGVMFDETGTSQAGVHISTYSWFPDNALLFGGSGAGGAVNLAKLTLVGRLNNATGPGGTVNPDAGNNFTYVMSIPVTVGDNGSRLQLTFDATRAGGADDYFRMYHTTSAVNQGTGAGYASGTKILDTTTGFDGNTMNLGYAFVNETAGLYDRLKQGDPNGNLVPTLVFSASETINLEVTSQDSSYFRTELDTLSIDLQLITQGFGAPFPDTAAPVVASNYQGLGHNVGAAEAATVQNNNGSTTAVVQALNDNTCNNGGRDGNILTNDCDIRLATGAGDLQVLAEIVPEPASLALIGLGLGALGMAGLRRRRPTA